MELHLFEDRIVAGQEIVLADTPARAIYVNAGAVTCNGTVHECDAGFLADGAVTITAGSSGATLWRWDLSHMATEVKGYEAIGKLTGAIPAELAGGDSFLRLDSVSFPPGGTAMLHTHQGPGIRCLREGSIRIDTEGTSTSYGPGSAWFETGPHPVFAQADHAISSRFIRATVLPKTLLGQSSIRYVNEADKSRPKSQSYHGFGEIMLSL
ncbi:MAG: hypothetical protein ACR2OW_15080 [Methyloligellaceae bacterium]